MAYAALPAKTATDTLDLADYNKIKGNFEASGIDIVTAKGDVPVATGANALTPLAVGANKTILVPDSGQASGLAWQIQPACRAYHNAAQTPSVSSWSPLNLNQERYDSHDCHDNTTLNFRLTVPTNGDGIYLIGATVCFDTSVITPGTSGRYGIRILLNGTTVIAQHYDEAEMMGDDICMTISTIYSMAATAFVQIQVYTTQAINILGADTAQEHSPELWFQWLRRLVP